MKKILEIINPYILQPLKIGGSCLTNRQYSNFFLSFSDSFLSILNVHGIKDKKDSILLPNFYCIETLNFISQRLNIIFYKVNNDFTIDKANYFQQIIKYKPRIILNYCFLGFSLSAEEKFRLADLCDEKTIIIEDYAHRVICDSEITFINKNHYYVDSIRKHCPLLGSHLVTALGTRLTKDTVFINWYKIKCQILFLFYNILKFFVYIFNSKIFFYLSEKIFEKFNLTIGAVQKKPTQGPIISYYIYSLIDSQKIKKHKQSIIDEFNQQLGSLDYPYIKKPSPQIISLTNSSNYYPIFIDESIQAPLVMYLSKKNIFPWRLWDVMETPYLPQLNNDLYKSFLVFPLHWLITKKDIHSICHEIVKFIKDNKKYE